MAPFLLIAVALFAGFLLILALIAFAAYRVAAKREGSNVSAAGGCALSAVLLGAALFALIGFVVVVGLLFARQAMQDGTLEIPEHHGIFQRDPPSWEPAPAYEVKPPSKDKDDGVRQY